MKKTDHLTGKLFLRPEFENHQDPWQRGRIDSRLNKDHYLIEVYSVTDGGPSYLAVASIASMASWKIYHLNEGREAWTREAERLGAVVTSQPAKENA